MFDIVIPQKVVLASSLFKKTEMSVKKKKNLKKFTKRASQYAMTGLFKTDKKKQD